MVYFPSKFKLNPLNAQIIHCVVTGQDLYVIALYIQPRQDKLSYRLYKEQIFGLDSSLVTVEQTIS
jgi:hypothetical protein